jgi:hypothetical protein
VLHPVAIFWHPNLQAGDLVAVCAMKMIFFQGADD